MQKQSLSLIKPLLRGHFHQAAFFVALGACILLISKSSNFISLVSASVYSLGLCGLFGVSALYHRINWSNFKRKWMRKLDHSFIFIQIAGTATPICLLAMNDESGQEFLKIIWLAATIGVLQSLFWIKAPKWISATLYIFVGWLAIPYVSDFKATLGLTNLIFLFIGGIFYSVGAFIYAFKAPNPWPKYFGYHEIFHFLVIVAAASHFIVVHGLIN